MPEANRSRGPKPVIPVTIVTGFLGAGKTSLLNRLVRDPALAGTGFIINEFGEIGIDHLLVEAADDGIVELSSGCLCCTVRGELVTTLENFLRGLDNGRIDTLSRIVIETTGLADPVPVLATLTAHPYLSLRYAIDGVITVVDAVNGGRTLDEHMEAVKQVAVADRLVIAKADLPEGAARLPALRRRLAALNPGAPLIDAATATPADLLGCGLYDPATKTADVRRWLNAEAFADAHEHHHDHDCTDGSCDHPSHHHDHVGHHHHHGDAENRHDGVSAFSLVSDEALPARCSRDVSRTAAGCPWAQASTPQGRGEAGRGSRSSAWSFTPSRSCSIRRSASLPGRTPIGGLDSSSSRMTLRRKR